MRREIGFALGLALLIQLAALDAGFTSYSLPSDAIVVTSSADSGPGTLRQALLDAKRGDVIKFDQAAFPPRSPTTITINSRLPEIAQGNLAIDASDAGVILDGSGLGKTPEMLLLDDISLTVGEGPNLIENGDFSSGSKHWRPWDDDSGATRDLKYNDFHSTSQSYAWATVAHAGESHAVYDTNDTSKPFAYRAYFWPFYFGSTVWMALKGGGTAELRLWYKYGGLNVWLHALFPDGHMENFLYKWFDRSDEWTEGVTSQVVPSEAVGVALELGFNHPEIWTNGLSIRSEGNVVRGLQIIGFPQAGIALYGGARNNVVGGDRSIGAGPLGQGNLISGDGNIGIGIWDLTTSFNVIKGNYIGTDLSGTVAWGRRQDGIHINGAHHNRIIDNLISGNGGNGVQVFNNNDSSNRLLGNYIGTDASGVKGVGNRGQGIYIHQANNIVIGPGNIIAFNGGDGIIICADSMHNTIIQNSIHDSGGNGISVRANSQRNRITRNSIYNNSGNGIWLCNRGNAELSEPTILDFDLKDGTVTGMASANCTVEIFSDSSNEGEVYEGQTTADDMGFFILDKGSQLTGPHITATASDEGGDTSSFSAPTEGPGTSMVLQVGDVLLRTPIMVMKQGELEDNHIGVDFGSFDRIEEDALLRIGVRWVRLAFDGAGDPLNWQRVEREPGTYAIDPAEDAFIMDLADNGVNIILNLGVGTGDGRTDYTRFSAEEEKERYASYVRFVVQHFKGHIKYYELWNEPDTETPWGGIPVENYASLIEHVVPVIRQEDPEAKVVIGATGGYRVSDFPGYGTSSRYTLHVDYLEDLLRAGVAPLVDAISWHPFYGNRPDDPYFRNYPHMLEEVREAATSLGFKGEFIVEEIVWRSEAVPGDGMMPMVSEDVVAKYFARAIVMHLGLNVTASTAGQLDLNRPVTRTVRFLCTVMAGARSARLPFEIRSDEKDIESYCFLKSNGDELIALWADEVAVEGDFGVNVTLILDGSSNRTVTGIDVLRGFEQRIVTKSEGGKAIIGNLLVRDYPLIILLSAAKTSSSTSTSLAISTPCPEISVKTGRILYFTVILGNLAEKGMTFHLSATFVPPGWATSFRTDVGDSESTSSLSLEAGGTEVLYLKAVPIATVGVGVYNFTVEVTSEEGASRNLTVAARVTGLNEVDLVLSTLLVKARAGEVSALSAVVKNAGTTRLTNVTLEIKAPSGWQVIQMPDYLDSLEPEEFGNVTLMLSPPGDVDAGDYVMGVTCVSDGGRSSELPMTVSVQSSSINLWAAGIVPIVIAAVILIASYLIFARKQ